VDGSQVFGRGYLGSHLCVSVSPWPGIEEGFVRGDEEVPHDLCDGGDASKGSKRSAGIEDVVSISSFDDICGVADNIPNVLRVCWRKDWLEVGPDSRRVGDEIYNVQCTVVETNTQ